MPVVLEKFHCGIDTLRQGQYAEAIQYLEGFLKEGAPGSKPYLMAQMHLVEAYQGNGEGDLAISLCLNLATSDNPKVQQWAQQVIKELSPVRLTSSAPPSTPTPTSAPELASPIDRPASSDGDPAKSETTSTEIERDAQTEPSQSDTDQLLEEVDAALQAEMQLVEAYQAEGKKELAVSVCLTLATSNNPKMQKWAQHKIRDLSVVSSSAVPSSKSIKPPAASQSAPQVPTSSGSKRMKGSVLGYLSQFFMNKNPKSSK